MRSLLLAALATALIAVAALDALAGVTNRYVGKTSEKGAMSFKISADGKKVVQFRFVNRCPADSSKGTLVNGSMPISRRGSFSRHDQQFTISGKFNTGGASGTARDVTGDCDSGKLHWTATLVHKSH
jgi:hypothetical protein